MLKKLAIILLGIICILLFIIKNKTPQPSEALQSTKKPSKSSKQLYQAPAKVVQKSKQETTPAAQNKVPTACKKVWPLLETVPTIDALSDPDLLHRACFNETPNSLANQNVLKSCFGNDLTKLENQTACMGSLAIYRSSVIFRLTEDEKDLSQLDSVTLINQIMALFSGAGNYKNTQDFAAQVEPRADALLAKEKDLFAAHKAVALVRVLKALSAAENKVSKDDEALMDKAAFEILDSADDFDVVDDEIAAARWAIYIKNRDLVVAEDLIDDYLERFPNSARAHYDKAYVFWKNGQLDAAQMHLKDAIRLNPDQLIYSETQKKIKSAKAGETIFDFNMNVNFDQL